MANKTVIGAGVRSPPPANSDSKFRNHAIDTALTISLLSSAGSNSRDLRQYSAANVNQHRKNEITSEKKQAKSQRKAFQAEDSRYVAIDYKQGLMNQRSEIIKSEYGSIKDYNIAKKSAGFTKSDKLLNIESKINNTNQQIQKAGKKIRKNTERAENIRIERGENQALRAGGKVYDKREVKEAKADRKAFRADVSRTVAVDDKRVLLRERTEIIKSDYGSIANYNIAKKSGGANFERMKSPKLQQVEWKIADLDAKTQSKHRKFKKHSSSAEKLSDKRSQSKYFRQSGEFGNSLTSNCKFERKAAKSDIKLAKAERKISHRIVRKSYKFDSTTGKINKSLMIDKDIKPIKRGGIVSVGLKGATAFTALRLSQSIHGQISKHENDTQNVGLKAAHKAERFAEHGMMKSIQRTHTYLKERPYKKLSKLQHKADKANAKLYAKRKGGSARQMKKNAKTYMQRAKQSRIAQSPLQKLMEKMIMKFKILIKMAIKKIVVLLGKPLAILTAVLIVVSIIMALIIAITGSSGDFLGAFFTEDSEIHAAVAHANSHAQTAVQSAINSVVDSVPADSVMIEQYTLNYNPYALISVLSAFIYIRSGDAHDNSFIASDTHIRATIERFINTFYVVQYNTVVEIITEITVDDDGEETVTETTHTTLHIRVRNIGEDSAALAVFNSGSPYIPAMFEGYQMYMETLGFRSDLFPAWAQ
jgi:hypothetical protein